MIKKTQTIEAMEPLELLDLDLFHILSKFSEKHGDQKLRERIEEWFTTNMGEPYSLQPVEKGVK